jgi:hypothetical protein
MCVVEQTERRRIRTFAIGEHMKKIDGTIKSVRGRFATFMVGAKNEMPTWQV